MNEEKKTWVSINELEIMRKWVENKTPLALHLIGGKSLSGVLLWRDTYHIGIKLTSGKEILVPKHSILYIEPL